MVNFFIDNRHRVGHEKYFEIVTYGIWLVLSYNTHYVESNTSAKSI